MNWRKLNQVHPQFLTFIPHVVRPDTCLNLSDMSLVQQHHTQTALSDTTSDREGQLVVQQLLMEIELFALFLTLYLQLTQQTLLIHTDTHR